MQCSNPHELFRGNQIEFGAQQCLFAQLQHRMTSLMLLTGILVRDDRARDKLREEVGDIGLIM